MKKKMLYIFSGVAVVGIVAFVLFTGGNGQYFKGALTLTPKLSTKSAQSISAKTLSNIKLPTPPLFQKVANPTYTNSSVAGNYRVIQPLKFSITAGSKEFNLTYVLAFNSGYYNGKFPSNCSLSVDDTVKPGYSIQLAKNAQDASFNVNYNIPPSATRTFAMTCEVTPPFSTGDYWSAKLARIDDTTSGVQTIYTKTSGNFSEIVGDTVTY
jgi:hypothetical protein